MTPADPRAARFEPEPSSGRQVRHFVVETLRGWRLDDVVDDAALCVAELATNAVLHTRAPFTVTVRRLGRGVRIDVLDAGPERVPAPVPRRGSATDLSAVGTTGRGLQMVAVVASRWGFSTTPENKTVWVELDPAAPPGPIDPVVSLTTAARPGGMTHRLRYLDLPVRPAVASGIQVEDIVRQIQLNPGQLDGSEEERLFLLLDRCAGPRLAGRHAALAASGEGRLHYDLDLLVTDESLAATMELSRLLDGLTARPAFRDAEPRPEVVALRSWLVDETVRQLDGADPLPYPRA